MTDEQKRETNSATSVLPRFPEHIYLLANAATGAIATRIFFKIGPAMLALRDQVKQDVAKTFCLIQYQRVHRLEEEDNKHEGL